MSQRNRQAHSRLPPFAHCARCGKRNDNHNVRHPFVPVGIAPIDPWGRIATLEELLLAADHALRQIEGRLYELRSVIGTLRRPPSDWADPANTAPRPWGEGVPDADADADAEANAEEDR
jgi:hypothetical protein